MPSLDRTPLSLGCPGLLWVGEFLKSWAGFPVTWVGPSPALPLVEPIEFPTCVVLLWVWRVGDHNEELGVYSRKPGQLRMGPDGSLL